MKNGMDSTAVERAQESETFTNRKLIRPSLSRDLGRSAAASRIPPSSAGSAPSGAGPSPAQPGKRRLRSRPTRRIFIIRSRCSPRRPWSSCCRTAKRFTASSSGTTRAASRSPAAGSRTCSSTSPASSTCTRNRKPTAEDRGLTRGRTSLRSPTLAHLEAGAMAFQAGSTCPRLQRAFAMVAKAVNSQAVKWQMISPASGTMQCWPGSSG